MGTSAVAPRISKTRFLAGTQCHKLLWWTVHDPDASELERDASSSLIVEQGILVGEAARTRFAGGALVDVPHQDIAARLRRTRRLLKQGATVIFEAAFRYAGVFVAVDVLRRAKKGWDLIEVKSSTAVKEEHLSDVAVQWWVVKNAGLPLRRAFVMHLNRQASYPDVSKLFTKVNVTTEVRARTPVVAQEARAQRRMLRGSLPKVEVGDHCSSPRACPFHDRCHEEVDEHHVTTLHGIGKRAWGLVDSGVSSIADLDEKDLSSSIARRQVRAVRRGRASSSLV